LSSNPAGHHDKKKHNLKFRILSTKRLEFNTSPALLVLPFYCEEFCEVPHIPFPLPAKEVLLGMLDFAQSKAGMRPQ